MTIGIWHSVENKDGELRSSVRINIRYFTIAL